MKIKYIILGLCLSLAGLFAQAQNGLEKVYVERYYVSNAADAAGSAGTLPEGSVTYRIYADMLPGYKLQTVFGIPTHPLLINTTTSFFNNMDYGATTPGFNATNAKKNTVMLDSWLSFGGACAGYNGVLKTEDDGVGNFVNTNGLLQNNAAQAGIPLTTQDGMLAGTVSNISTMGLDAILGVFGDGTTNGNSFLASDGSWYCLGGASGPTASNKVLIAQITTNGTLHFELNMQIGTPLGGTENYVYSNPTGVELTIPSLTQTFLAVPLLPTVSITAPTEGATSSIGSPISIAATAADADGSVTQVEFFVDGVSIGIDATAPYTASYTGLTEASHVLTAKATDNEGFSTTSTPVNFNVGNAAPTVSISAPLTGSVYVVGDVVPITAIAADTDGTIASVEFFVDGVSAGVDNSSPYTATYTSVYGVHSLTAKATDNIGGIHGTTISAPVSITVNTNNPPTVTITAPLNGATPALNALLTITANVADGDGSVVSAEFFKGATSLGTGIIAAGVATFSYTPSVQGPVVFTVKATDNKGAVTTSASVTVTITDFSSAYAITFVTQACNVASACMPITTVNPVSNVNGYNFTVQYDKTKVAPTGIVTVSNALISAAILSGHNAEYVTDYTTSIDAVAGKISIAIYFNSNAGANPVFNGSGDVCCVEFAKTAGMGSTDAAVFSFSEILESYPAAAAASKTGSPGNLISYKEDKFYGSLKFWFDSSPIIYDNTNPTAHLITNILGCGTVTPAVQPDLSGNFIYSILNGTTVDVERNIADATLVHTIITANDAVIAAKISVKAVVTPTPTVYQMIASDVNRDGLVTAGDATQIGQRAVHLITAFTQIDALGKDWSFVANTLAATAPYLISATFPEDDGHGYSKYRVPVVTVCQEVPATDVATCPVIGIDNYMGVMIGDVDGSYASAGSSSSLKSATVDTTAEIIIDLAHAVTANGIMSIPVSLTSAEVVNSFDFDMVLNNLNSSVLSVESQYGINVSWNYISSDSMLSVATYSLDPVPTANTIIIKLALNGTSPITGSDLLGTLSLINGTFAKFTIIDATTALGEDTKDNLIKVYPNPASDKLNIEVSVNSKIQLLDLNGKLIVAEQNVNANQKQTIDVSNVAAGVYMLKVYNNSFVKMQKVIVKK
ncbi:MAG: Ig-like domain-containing protein [Bacteroidota bacterium]